MKGKTNEKKLRNRKKIKKGKGGRGWRGGGATIILNTRRDGISKPLAIYTQDW